MISFLSNKKKIFFNFLFVQQCMFGEAAKVYEKLEDPLRLPGISNNLHTVIQYLTNYAQKVIDNYTKCQINCKR